MAELTPEWMRSSQGLLADRLAKERTYDAFGVFSAVERAQNPPGVLGRTLSRLQDFLVSGVSMSALILHFLIRVVQCVH